MRRRTTLLANGRRQRGIGWQAGKIMTPGLLGVAHKVFKQGALAVHENESPSESIPYEMEPRRRDVAWRPSYINGSQRPAADLPDGSFP